MEESEFFKYVWRFNAIVLMIAGILAIGVLAFAGYQIYSETTRERETGNIVNIQQNSDVKEKWRLGNLSKIQGTPFVMIPLNSDQSYDQDYYSKSTSSARNYLFINSSNNEKHWLLDENTLLVVYQKQGIGYSANVNLSEFDISNQEKLPKVVH